MLYLYCYKIYFNKCQPNNDPFSTLLNYCVQKSMLIHHKTGNIKILVTLKFCFLLAHEGMPQTAP